MSAEGELRRSFRKRMKTDKAKEFESNEDNSVKSKATTRRKAQTKDADEAKAITSDDSVETEHVEPEKEDEKAYLNEAVATEALVCTHHYDK